MALAPEPPRVLQQQLHAQRSPALPCLTVAQVNGVVQRVYEVDSRLDEVFRDHVVRLAIATISIALLSFEGAVAKEAV